MLFLFFERMNIFYSPTKITTAFVHSPQNNCGTFGRQVWSLPSSSLWLSHRSRSTHSVFAPLLNSHSLPWASIEQKRKKGRESVLKNYFHCFLNISDKNTHPLCPCLRTFALASSSARTALPQHILLLLLSLFRGDLLRPSHLEPSCHPHPRMLCPPSYFIFP